MKMEEKKKKNLRAEGHTQEVYYLLPVLHRVHVYTKVQVRVKMLYTWYTTCIPVNN